MGTLTEFEEKRLNQLCAIVNSILERMDYEHSLDIKLKYDTTPDEEKLSVCIDDLKEIQDRLLDFEWYFKDYIQARIRSFRTYFYGYIESKKKNKELEYIVKEDYHSNRRDGFVKNLVLSLADENDSFPYLEFDYDKINIELIEQEDWYWYINPEIYIPLPEFNEVVKCVHLIEYFEVTFEVYHSFLDEKNSSKINSYIGRQKSGFTNPLSDDQINSCYEKLRGSFIPEDTRLSNFKLIFKNEPLPPYFDKIIWIGLSGQLAYFVDSLFYETEPHLWAKAKNSFIKANNLKQSKDLYLNNKSGKPKGFEQIDKIIEIIYTPLL